MHALTISFLVIAIIMLVFFVIISYSFIGLFLSELGLSVIMSTPEEHDIQMARSLALIHLLGRGLCRVSVNPLEMTTPTHKLFINLVNIVRNDSDQLFVDMQIYNRYARKTRKALLRELLRIDGELDAKV